MFDQQEVLVNQCGDICTLIWTDTGTLTVWTSLKRTRSLVTLHMQTGLPPFSLFSAELQESSFKNTLARQKSLATSYQFPRHERPENTLTAERQISLSPLPQLWLPLFHSRLKQSSCQQRLQTTGAHIGTADNLELRIGTNSPTKHP